MIDKVRRYYVLPLGHYAWPCLCCLLHKHKECTTPVVCTLWLWLKSALGDEMYLSERSYTDHLSMIVISELYFWRFFLHDLQLEEGDANLTVREHLSIASWKPRRGLFSYSVITVNLHKDNEGSKEGQKLITSIFSDTPCHMVTTNHCAALK